jgi:hypothetical protein
MALRRELVSKAGEATERHVSVKAQHYHGIAPAIPWQCRLDAPNILDYRVGWFTASHHRELLQEPYPAVTRRRLT